MPRSLAWRVVVGGAILAPLVTWWPMLKLRFPGLAIPAYEPATGIDLWGAQTFWLVICAALAATIAVTDVWLGLAVLDGGLLVFFRGLADPTHTILFAVGALVLVLMRAAPPSARARILAVCAGLGTVQAVYMLQQAWGHYDLLWGPLLTGHLNAVIQPLGTLGTVDAAAAYVAITAPLMPPWLLPVAIAAVWTSQSMGATAALLAGLAIRITPSLYRWSRWSVAAAGCLLPVAAAYFLTYVKTMDSVWPRVAVWRFGWHNLITTDPLLGWGLGGWAARIPREQIQSRFNPTGELFREAHNEWVQWTCELGAVGLVLLGGWLWTHRTMFTVPSLGAACVALAITCGSFFPLHTVPTALLAIVLVGVATADADPLTMTRKDC